MTALFSRLVRRRPRADRLTFTVYTRQQCCCCHKALDLLKSYQRKHRFAIEKIDIDTDPALVEQHGTSVPVIVVGGKIRFRGVVNPVLLERLLAAEARGR
ncbi:MAG: glutaredoxin family protein [Isosphaeraceae bacterium]|nr:glutaredoxin family protein [Isosphaeraceae bacterium]